MACYIATQRHCRCRENGIKDRQIGPQSWIETDLQGIGGELAFCQIFNLFPSLSLHMDDGFDCVSHKGARIDVKTTKYNDGRLIVHEKKKLGDADIYALMVGNFPTFEFRGWIKSEDVFTREKADLGHGSHGYMIDQGELNRLVS